MTAPRVAVIGGGAAGLVAALQLRAFGADVTLLEAHETVGGMIRTVHRAGWIVEQGANSLAEPEPAVRALLDGAGLAGRTMRTDSRNTRRYLVHQGKLAAVPKSVGELLAWPLLSAAGRMRLLKEPFIKAAPADAEESVDRFVRRRLGDEMAERVFDPLVGASCAGDPAQVLMRYAFPRLVEWEQRGGSLLKGSMRVGMEARRKAGKNRGGGGGLWSCPDGLSEIPQRLAGALGAVVHTGLAVREVRRTIGGFDLVAADGQQERFEGVVCAVPAAALAGMRFDLAGAEVLDSIAAAPQASLASVSLGFPRNAVAHALDGHGLLVPSAERRDILGTLFVSSLFPDRTPEGHVLLTSFVGGVRRPELAGLTHAELIELVRRELGDLLGVRGEPSFTSAANWPASQSQAVAGHGARLERVAALEAASPGLAFAGGWHDGLALTEAMRGGRLAAVRVAERLHLQGADTPPSRGDVSAGLPQGTSPFFGSSFADQSPLLKSVKRMWPFQGIAFITNGALAV